MFVVDETASGERVIKDVPVAISTVGDGGVVKKDMITLDYLVLPTDESDAIIKDAQDGDENADLLKRVVVGWGGIKNKAGEAVGFTPEALALACKMPNFRSGALDSYFRTAAGGKPRRGN